MVEIDLNMKPREVEEDDAKEGSPKKPRNPKWVTDETMVMLKGKTAVENNEPGDWRSRVPMVGETGARWRKKWPLVSAYCEEHGVRRAPAECKMRWQNQIAKYRQISAWEASMGEGSDGGPGESYWEMTSPRRRASKLPGVFSREIYEFISQIRLARGDSDASDHDGDCDYEEEVEENGEHEKEDTEMGSESGNNDAKDVEKHGHEDMNKSLSERTSTGVTLKRKAKDPSRVSGKSESHDFSFCIQRERSKHKGRNRTQADIGDRKKKSETILSTCAAEGAGSDDEVRSTDGGEKEGQFSTYHSGEQYLKRRLISVMESNNKMLKAHFDACQEEREERNKQANSLIAVLGKITDAIKKIAEK